MTETEFTIETFTALYEKYATNLSHPAFHTHTVISRLYGICVRLMENAKKFNLTAITAPEAVVEKHIVDSLLPLALLQQDGVLNDRFQYGEKPVSICDIGAGAGFPSLPMAALLREFDGRVLAIDATAKKVRYIGETATLLDIPNLTAEAGRAEELARSGLRERFSIVTARAVAELRILRELCAPFVCVGGTFMAMKARAEEEFSIGGGACRPLGLDAGRQIAYALPGGDARTLILYKKTRSTEIPYPRPYAKILAKPL